MRWRACPSFSWIPCERGEREGGGGEEVGGRKRMGGGEMEVVLTEVKKSSKHNLRHVEKAKVLPYTVP